MRMKTPEHTEKTPHNLKVPTRTLAATRFLDRNKLGSSREALDAAAKSDEAACAGADLGDAAARTVLSHRGANS